MKNHFTINEAIRIAYIAYRDGDDSFINCFYHCMELRKYCNDFLNAGGTYSELKEAFFKAERDCN